MNKKLSKFILTFLLLTKTLGAQDVVPESTEQKAAKDITLDDLEMSYKYTKGGHLLYDCQDKHFVCTSKVETKRCKTARKNSILDNDDILPCAITQKFKDYNECKEFQQKRVNMAINHMYCYHPDKREAFLFEN